MSVTYDKDDISALEAITEAQKIAFAPMTFQAALSLRDLGILAYLDEKNRDNGATLSEIVEHCDLSKYAIDLLLDVGLSVHILYKKEDKYFLGKIGHYLLHDQRTRVNMDFTQDVCYQGLFFLKESLQEGKPVGLKTLGDWPTIYPALSILPPKVKESWFAFDHFYSDGSFKPALKAIFDLKPKHIYDVGGNTGKWALQCCAYDPEVKITILDLPEQVVLAKENIAKNGLVGRINTHEVNVLTAEAFPCEADLWWMSQFLDCFGEEEIIRILSLAHAAMNDNARLCILELFWDKQNFEAAAVCLNMSSLYFTCIANGTSRFYHSDVFVSCLTKAGFEVEKQIDDIGVGGHSLMICRKLSIRSV